MGIRILVVILGAHLVATTMLAHDDFVNGLSKINRIESFGEGTGFDVKAKLVVISI